MGHLLLEVFTGKLQLRLLLRRLGGGQVYGAGGGWLGDEAVGGARGRGVVQRDTSLGRGAEQSTNHICVEAERWKKVRYL